MRVKHIVTRVGKAAEGSRVLLKVALIRAEMFVRLRPATHTRPQRPKVGKLGVVIITSPAKLVHIEVTKVSLIVSNLISLRPATHTRLQRPKVGKLGVVIITSLQNWYTLR